jgi:hypothetical protein
VGIRVLVEGRDAGTVVVVELEIVEREGSQKNETSEKCIINIKAAFVLLWWGIKSLS